LIHALAETEDYVVRPDLVERDALAKLLDGAIRQGLAGPFVSFAAEIKVCQVDFEIKFFGSSL
jgi:hypothetical protein